MIANVLSNAAKYSPRPGRVVARFDTHQRGLISLSFMDNGIGIPEEELPKVFQDFYRASNSKKLGIEGTGLGTSIISHVIGQHHGSVQVESPSPLKEEGRPGTSITIILPIQYSHDEEILRNLPSTNELAH
jgi:signal transduction histidine kinase